MIRVGLARTTASYQGLTPPWDPNPVPPELGTLSASGAAPNHVHAAVRSALCALGLDAARFGTSQWNPLGQLVRPGGRVVLKPNFIRHWHPHADERRSVESVITHGSVIRALADYAFLAVGPTGAVTIAEAPQQDCDFAQIRALAGLDTLKARYAEHGFRLEIIDLRRECVEFRDGIITKRSPLPGDPAGYRVVDLGEQSFFTGSGLDAQRFRGADYDPGPTVAQHIGGRNAYLLSETVLRADLIVNLPKLKTHKKTGVTLALKNLVGINGDKNWLPHHCAGAANEGGDEFPGERFLDRLRSRAIEHARTALARGRAISLLRVARRLEGSLRGTSFIRSGNWHGNRTTWRMCCDLNRCVYYSDATELHLAAPAPVRSVLTVIDGVVAGEGDGPLAPTDVALGAVIAATDPIAADLVAVRLMGFDESRIPKLAEPMRDLGPRITAVRSSADVEVAEHDAKFGLRYRRLDDVTAERRFAPHPGWVGAIERVSAKPARAGVS